MAIVNISYLIWLRLESDEFLRNIHCAPICRLFILNESINYLIKLALAIKVLRKCNVSLG
jgi:hypothetical protein